MVGAFSSICLDSHSLLYASIDRTVRNSLIIILTSLTVFLIPSLAQNLPDVLAISAFDQPASPEVTLPANTETWVPTSESNTGRDHFSREWLEAHGFAFALQYRADIFSNLRGGMPSTPTGAYLGSTDAALQFDLRKMHFGRGQIVVTSEFVHGHTINESEVGAAQSMSNLDAAPFCKVVEAYFSDTFFHERLTIKLGRQYADSDFNAYEAGGYFLNSSYGMNPTIPMPTYPEPQPGASLWFSPKKWLSVGGGIYRNKVRSSVQPYPVDSAAFTLLESKFHSENSWSRGDYSIAVWRQSGDGRRNPLNPDQMRHNYGFYGTGNHWFNKPNSAGENIGPAAFFQFGWAPADRNLISRYLGGGLAWPGLLKIRPRDSVGVGVTQATLPGIAAAETISEVFYIVHINRYLSLEPDIQYVHQAAGSGRDVLLGGLRVALAY